MNSVILVAGGTGSRMKGKVPKQFELLYKKPVIVHSIEKFLRFDQHMQVIVSIHPDFRKKLADILKKFGLKSIAVVDGGETRFHSVKNALAVLDNKAKIVAVHDAARPLVSIDTIKNIFSQAKKTGAAIPVIAMNESLRKISRQSSRAVDRNKYVIVQTPQCFKKELLLKAYHQKYNSSFTDDATVVELLGKKISLTEGNVENIKITYPKDLIIASALLK
jgi:2-C-methyl-D-erythritol 4-phosphate cytidylyltransferase